MTELSVVPPWWRRLRSVLRAVLGFACLANQLLGTAPHLGITVGAGLFAVYAVVVLVLPRFNRLQTSLAGLFIETAWFVIFSTYGADRATVLGSVFFLYLMLAAVLDHDWGDVMIIVGACLGFFLIVRSPEIDALRRVVAISGVLAAALGYFKKKSNDQLMESVRREEVLRIEGDKVRELERIRIAGDFHDGPLQTFIGFQVRLEILSTLFKRDPHAALEDLKELQQLARSQVSEIRSFLRAMKPAEVDASDLVASTRRIVEFFQKDTGIPSRFVSSQTSLKPAQETTHEILQVLREALHNVHKHAKASRVVVALEQAGKAVEISVDDDGTGFAFSGSFNLDELDLLRLGPQSIKRRVRSLGGELQIESRPGHGASIKMRLPI